MSTNRLAIKVCGLRDAENIQKVSALDIDYLGFIFYPNSKRYVGESFLIPDSVVQNRSQKFVGVFVNQDLHEVASIADRYNLNVIQLHGKESKEYCSFLHRRSPMLEIWKAFHVDQAFNLSTLEQYKDCCDKYLFDTANPDYGGSGVKFDWSQLNSYSGIKDFILSGGIGVRESAQAVDSFSSLNSFFGIDINSRVETEPGLKSTALINQVVEEVRK